MTRSPDGRCADCVTVGDTPDLAEPYRRYCWLHGYERERHRKRRNKVVSRARKKGKPVPPPETYTPVPRAHFGAIYLDGNEISSLIWQSYHVRDLEDRVGAAMDGKDHYAVGLAAEDLVTANRKFRNLLFIMLGRNPE